MFGNCATKSTSANSHDSLNDVSQTRVCPSLRSRKNECILESRYEVALRSTTNGRNVTFLCGLFSTLHQYAQEINTEKTTLRARQKLASAFALRLKHKLFWMTQGRFDSCIAVLVLCNKSKQYHVLVSLCDTCANNDTLANNVCRWIVSLTKTHVRYVRLVSPSEPRYLFAARLIIAK